MTVHATIEPVYEPSARSDAAYAKPVDTFSVASGHPARERRPFAPGELVSLWDMLRVYAKDFVVLMQTIDRFRGGIRHIHQQVAMSRGVFAGDPELVRDSCAGLWEVVGPLLDEAEAACTRMELKDPIALMRKVRSCCAGHVYSIPELQGWLGSIGELVHTQLNDRLLFCVGTDRAEYWSDTPLFGQKVQAAHPDACDDMVEAGRCLVVGRYKACVFHLMLVVEIGVRQMAGILGVTPSHKDTWGAILNQLSHVVAAMPTRTVPDAERKSAFSKAADHLNHIKDGWRNKTMHPGLGYNEEQAVMMFKNVVAFMELLVDLR